MNIENQIKENQKEIFIKRQKVDEENINIKKLENLCADKNKAILDAQIEIEKKQSQLEVSIFYKLNCIYMYLKFNNLTHLQS